MNTKLKLRYQINTNFEFASQIQALMEKHGVEILPLVAERSKSIGFMGQSGSYVIGGMIVNDYGHYANTREARIWGIESIDGCSSFTIAQDESGGYWMARCAFASVEDSSVDWEAFNIEAR